jgi:hypothetical protein
MGQWFRTIKVGDIGASSQFEVFDSHGRFNVIFGKHYYNDLDFPATITVQMVLRNNGR